MPIAHLLELWKGIEVEPMETETMVEDAALDEEPVKEHCTIVLIKANKQANPNLQEKTLGSPKGSELPVKAKAKKILGTLAFLSGLYNPIDEEAKLNPVLAPEALQVSGFETGIEKLIFLPDRFGYKTIPALQEYILKTKHVVS
ncbi:hypothetical protein HGM15179_009951 [Zosterops borbonicus]|uniref:Uncharacterized protein n=1 Tax=Zosterops borbonicus TaxID=364589 RepID=A0A8K1GFQ7_9PASS|nr:hypothetical protein HGM15179_009951 [Zosterops borbonicus]